ncbi:MAG: hypothetical protein AMJ54_00965 [Deltaproteobacteria bacterium SG8_13]|nr:MAG: hypothetical protein AMJ54_00965 [Deltaproteobacteria bacterium SG8_13]
MGKTRILNIAHRGARSLAPENTLAAARAALEVGADIWETDVGVTRDGVLILFHNDSLNGTTDAQLVFPDRAPWIFTRFDFAELQKLDAGSWFVRADPFDQIKNGAVPAERSASYRGEKIPTLEEALLFTRDAGWRINIELKQLPPPMEKFPVLERVLSMIDRLGIGPEQFVLSSFKLDWLKQIHRLRSEIELQAVVGFSKVKPIRWEPLEFETYNARYNLVKEATIRTLSEKGVAINVWAVNEESDMRRFMSAGVAGIITDFPQRLTRIRNEA